MLQSKLQQLIGNRDSIDTELKRTIAAINATAAPATTPAANTSPANSSANPVPAGDVRSTTTPCEQLLDVENHSVASDSPCLRIEIDPRVPDVLATKVCVSCSERPCIWERLVNLKHMPRSTTPTNYLFSKAYVVHYTPRVFRKHRMVERLRQIGLVTDDEGDTDNVAMVSDFDAEEIPPAARECLGVSHGPLVSNTSSLVRNRRGCISTHGRKNNDRKNSGGMMSVALKHYAAYYDMLRMGYAFALVAEDDARFDNGAKVLEGTRNKKKDFRIDLGYEGYTFEAIFNKEITKELPRQGNLAPGYVRDVVPLTTASSAVNGTPVVSGLERFNFDFLQLAACDGFIAKEIEPNWNKGGTYWGLKKFSKHLLSTTDHCSRCMINYVVSLTGAAKVLSHTRGICGPVDLSFDSMAREVPALSAGRTFNCIHAFPNIAWEDPGPEGDGDFVGLTPKYKNHSHVHGKLNHSAKLDEILSHSEPSETAKHHHHETSRNPTTPNTAKEMQRYTSSRPNMGHPPTTGTTVPS